MSLSAICPNCGEEVVIPQDFSLGGIVSCNECNDLLEISNTNPLTLSVADETFFDEETWDESQDPLTNAQETWNESQIPLTNAKRRDVKESNVISRWGVLVQGLAGKEKRFFDLVRSRLNEQGWPYPVTQIEVGGGLFSGAGKFYLETKSGKLVAYIGGESIGKNIYLGWSLTLEEPGWFAKAAASAGGISAAIFQQLNFNQANSARAFATSLNYAVQEAVDILLDDAGLDKSKIDRKVSGLLI